MKWIKSEVKVVKPNEMLDDIENEDSEEVIVEDSEDTEIEDLELNFEKDKEEKIDKSEKKLYNVVWQSKHTIQIEAKSEENAISLVVMGEYDEDDVEEERVSSPKIFKGSDEVEEEI